MLRRASVGLALLVLGLTGAAPGMVRDHDRAELAAVISQYEHWSRPADPLTAGLECEEDALSRLPHVRSEARQRWFDDLEHCKRRLADIDPASLSDDEALNHAFLTRVVADALGSLEF